jgi:hypothetical protein
MEFVCGTRSLKNAKFLQRPEAGFFPVQEPDEGFASVVPLHVLRRVERMRPEEAEDESLARALAKASLPRGGNRAAAPLFSGTLYFVQASFASSGRDYSVPVADMQTAVQYAALSMVPISEYALQYGPNTVGVSSGLVSFQARVRRGKYNDQALGGWVDEVARGQGLGAGSCIAFLNPQGVVNTDADATQGVLGYHGVSPAGVPYVFVNVTGVGLTVEDEQDYYALALSHEIAEMTVDPKADGSNPEVCDPCAGNCSIDHRNYFDPSGKWVGGSPTPGYSFFVDGIATPETVSQCPAPSSSCSYPPPLPAGNR